MDRRFSPFPKPGVNPKSMFNIDFQLFAPNVKPDITRQQLQPINNEIETMPGLLLKIIVFD